MSMLEKTCQRPGCNNTFWVETPEKKPQLYCSGRCRTIVSRQKAEREKRENQELHIKHLRETWQQFSPEVRAKLEELLRIYNNDAAQVATDALLLQWQECQALARLKYREGYAEAQDNVTHDHETK
jgi:hypothetical protein